MMLTLETLQPLEETATLKKSDFKCQLLLNGALNVNLESYSIPNIIVLTSFKPMETLCLAVLNVMKNVPTKNNDWN